MLLMGPGGRTAEFFRIAGGNIRSRLHPQDLEAQLYWGAAARRGIDADKVGLEVLRAIMPAYFFDRDKALEFAAQLPEGTVHADASRYLRIDLAETYDLLEALREFGWPGAIVQGHQDPVPEATTGGTPRVLKVSSLQYRHSAG